MTWAWVALGAAVGAPLRYLADRAFNRGGWPWGTFMVNMAGSAVLGGLVTAVVTPAVSAVLGVGFCGALTTYSTFGYEVMRAARERPMLAATYAVGSLAAGLAAAYAGMAAVTLALR